MPKITSIKHIGKHQTYDLEIDHQDHQFYLSNGLLTSNSHSDSYAYISYQCAWLLFNYPSQWIAAVLETETAGSADDKASIISIVRSFGYNIQFPDINLSTDKWTIIDDNTFLAPFSLIKGVGEHALKFLKENAPYKDIESLLFNPKIDYRKVNKKILDGLCLSGALASLMDARFDHDRHFYSCVVADKKAKSIKKFSETIEENRNKFEPMSKSEIFNHRLTILGFLDLDLLMSSEVKEKLLNNNVPSISAFDIDCDKFCWFYLESFENKVSKSGNAYVLLKAIGSNLDPFEIYLFGYEGGEMLAGLCCVAEISKSIGPSRYSVYNGRIRFIK